MSQDIFGFNNEKHDTYAEGFALRLSELRNNLGVSARKMSIDLGYNIAYINNIENGKAFPKMEVFFEICDYLGVTPSEFFRYCAEDGASQKRTDLHKKIALMAEAQVDSIQGIVDAILH